MDDDSIIRAINLYKADWVVLTGGEPAMHIDSDFIHLLKCATGKKIAIETNGTYPVPENIDWVTVSPKTGFEGAGNHPIRVEHANEIKVVDLGQDLTQYFSLPCRGEDTIMYLQPCYVNNKEEFRKNIMNTVNRVLSNPEWTLSVQLHRFLNIP